MYLRYLIRKGHEKYEIRVFLEGFRGILLQVEKHIDDIADITCAISHVHAAAVIFQLLVDLFQNYFLQKIVRNYASSDRKVLQRFIDIIK